MEETRAKNYEFMDDEAREEAKAKLDAELNELMDRRREKMAEEAAELEDLKQQQAERKAEREREMEEMAERMREAEDRHKREEEERQAKKEEARMIRILAKQKTGEGNPKNEVTELSPEEIAKSKQDYMKAVQGRMSIEGLNSDALREKIHVWYAALRKLEGTRYDLEQRQKAQEYDMKELSDRESQKARSKAQAMGLDAEEAAASKHPPKVRLYSKNDRQVDHRPYVDRKKLYNGPATVKVFKVFHGSGKPPAEWKPRESEELENLKKSFEGFKYKEVKPVEGAKAPVPVIPAAVPEKDAFDIVPLEEILAAQEAAQA